MFYILKTSFICAVESACVGRVVAVVVSAEVANDGTEGVGVCTAREGVDAAAAACVAASGLAVAVASPVIEEGVWGASERGASELDVCARGVGGALEVSAPG
jgi:hypothetical protein